MRKVLFCLFAIIFSQSVFALKIIRIGEMGRMNIIPCHIHIEKIASKDSVLDYVLYGEEELDMELSSGRYKISVCTPVNEQQNYLDTNTDWTSNVLDYTVGKDAEVLYIYPTHNGHFYNGGWLISTEKKF